MAEFQIETQQAGETALIHCRGDLVFGEAIAEFNKAIRAEVDRKATIIMLDFSGIGKVDSTGIGALVANDQIVAKHGGKMTLLDMPGRVKKSMSITGVDTVLAMA